MKKRDFSSSFPSVLKAGPSLPHGPSSFHSSSSLRDELDNEAGWYGRGRSCLQAVELMFCETLTYRAEGVTSKSKPPSHPHRSGMTVSAQ